MFMKLMTEKEAERFLEKQKFEIVEGIFVNSVLGVKKALKKIGLPCVLKASGSKIIHKYDIDGVKMNIRTLSEAIYEFKNLKSIKGVSEVLIQKPFSGKEFLIGIKKTPEFEHVLVFGSGGTKVEIKKDVAFRICPVDKKEIKSMIKETKIGRRLPKKSKEILEDHLMAVCKLTRLFPKIRELDINPFTIAKAQGKVVDARIVF